MSALPDLITADYANAALAITSLTPAQTAFIPQAITAASTEIRRWCMNRVFTQMTFTDYYPITLDGLVRVDQIPVNQIILVQTNLQTALTIQNTSSDVQLASALFAYTGDFTDGQTIVGLTLNWTSSGVPSTGIVTYTDNMQISDLATAINAVGSGWSASATDQWAAWPVTELWDGYIGKGTSTTDSDTGICEFKVFSDLKRDVQFHQDMGQQTGMIWVGERYATDIGPKWGPYPADWDISLTTNPAICKVTYDAGFATIPAIVQFACVETVKGMLQRMRINPYLISERAGEYSYQLATQALMALPPYVLQELSQYRIYNA